MPRVTVILPTYKRNANGLLARAIKSVLNQPYEDLELVVVDDGSQDGTRETIAKLSEQDPRLRTIRFDKNVGLPALTTVAAYNATDSEFIAWQFDDSYWLPDHTATLIGRADAQPEADIVYGQAKVVLAGTPYVIGMPLQTQAMLYEHNHIPQASSLTRRSVHETLGWYDPSIVLKRTNDWDFWRRAAKAGTPWAFTPHVVQHDDGGGLPDSLGNAVPFERDLVFALFDLQRAAALHPKRSEPWSPYFLPDDLSLTPALWESAAFLFIDHAMAIGAWKPGEGISDPSFLTALRRAGLSLSEAPAFWARRLATANAKLKVEIGEQQATLTEKQNFIHTQARLIEAKDEHAAALEAQLRAQAEATDIEARKVRELAEKIQALEEAKAALDRDAEALRQEVQALRSLQSPPAVSG